MTENIDIECKRISFDGKTAELESVDPKELIIQMVSLIGIDKLLDYATDDKSVDLSDIVNFIDDQYDMESAIDCLDRERQIEVRESI